MDVPFGGRPFGLGDTPGRKRPFLERLVALLFDPFGLAAIVVITLGELCTKPFALAVPAGL